MPPKQRDSVSPGKRKREPGELTAVVVQKQNACVVVRARADERAPRRFERLIGADAIPYSRSFQGVAAIACVAPSQDLVCQSRFQSTCQLVSLGPVNGPRICPLAAWSICHVTCTRWH